MRWPWMIKYFLTARLCLCILYNILRSRYNLCIFFQHLCSMYPDQRFFNTG